MSFPNQTSRITVHDFCGSVFGNVQIHREYIHTAASGRRLLILHGDEFDGIVKHGRLLARIGRRAYGFLLRANVYVHFFRKLFNFPYWSLAAHLKHRVKNAVNYIRNFENALTGMAVDGVVCSHIHHAQITEIDGILHCNDGDWVESCTALIESHDGTLHLLRWTDEQKNSDTTRSGRTARTRKQAA